MTKAQKEDGHEFFLRSHSQDHLLPLLSLVAGAIVVSHATKSSAAAQVNRETAKILNDRAKDS